MAGSSRKRAIDLTADADDDGVQTTGSQTRKNPRLADVPVGSSHDDEDGDGNSLDEVIDPSQDYNDRAYIQYMLYGTDARSSWTMYANIMQAGSTRRSLVSAITRGTRPLMRW